MPRYCYKPLMITIHLIRALYCLECEKSVFNCHNCWKSHLKWSKRQKPAFFVESQQGIKEHMSLLPSTKIWSAKWQPFCLNIKVLKFTLDMPQKDKNLCTLWMPITHLSVAEPRLSVDRISTVSLCLSQWACVCSLFRAHQIYLATMYDWWASTGRQPPIALASYLWWCHDMETLSALLAICGGNRPMHGSIPLTKGQ